MLKKKRFGLILKGGNYFLALLILLFLKCNIAFSQVHSSDKEPHSKLWISAYLASWNHYAPPGGNWGDLPTDGIDWGAFTQLIYFALPPKPNGQIKSIAPYENVNPSRVRAITFAAHSHHKSILISIGGWGHYEAFSHAIAPANRKRFVYNLTQLIMKWNFDGIDLDMEPIKNKDINNYMAFVKELHQSLHKITLHNGKPPLLTAVTRWQPKMFAHLYKYLDQVNLMTYDLSGAWHGWVSWYNSPVYSSIYTFPRSNKPLPSVNQIVDKYLRAGIPSKKLGIGIDFYGYIWQGVSQPYKGWVFDAPKVKSNVPYNTIMKKYYKKDRYRWNKRAEAAYLTVNNDKDKLFISFDGRQTVKAKVHYAIQKKLGGIILWEIGASYFKHAQPGQRDSLLDAVKSSISNDF